MIERAYVWLIGENLLVFGGLAFALLGLACEAGFRLGGSHARRRPARDHEGVATITAGMMVLLSFTLGLTVSYAQDRAEARRGLVVVEANAIGSAWLWAKVAGGDEGPAIAKLVEEFAKVELAFAVARSVEPEAELIARREAIQGEISGLVHTVARRDPTRVATALITALNAMFDAALAQRFAFDNRVPPTLSWMLLCGSLLAIGAMGYQFGLAGARYPVLVSLLLAMWTGGIVLVVDLNRPRVGSMRVDPAPLVWTIQGFKTPSPHID